MKAVIAASHPRPNQIVRTDDFAILPAPVRRYFSHVLRDGQPYVETARIQQSGTFRGDGAAGWSPFIAPQHVAVRPPGFVWDASIRMMPAIPVRVLDSYHDGRGRLQTRLGGVVIVREGEPSPELDEGELLRYLAEAPLYPTTALLPSMGVSWTPIDDRSAQATLTDRGATASLVFHFNEQDEVTRVEGRRGFAKDDGTIENRPWIGYWRKYEERDDMRVPIDGEGVWIHPDAGEVSYWRGRMETITYRVAESGDDENDAGRRTAAIPIREKGSAKKRKEAQGHCTYAITRSYTTLMHRLRT